MFFEPLDPRVYLSFHPLGFNLGQHPAIMVGKAHGKPVPPPTPPPPTTSHRRAFADNGKGAKDAVDGGCGMCGANARACECACASRCP